MAKTCQHSCRPGFDDHATAEDGPAENEGDAVSTAESDISDLSPIDLLGGDRLDAIELGKTKNHAKMREMAEDGGIFVVREGIVGCVEDAKDIATEMAREETPIDDGGIFVVRDGVVSRVEDARDIPMEIARHDAKTEASSGLSQVAETEPPKHSSRHVPTSIECRIKRSTAIETVLTERTGSKDPNTMPNEKEFEVQIWAVEEKEPRNKRGVVRHLPYSLSWSIFRKQSTASF